MNKSETVQALAGRPKARDARTLISSALVKLSITDAGLYLTALKVDPVETNDPGKTLALKVGGGKAELLYNPQFVEAVGNEIMTGSDALKVLIGAEMARLLLMHATSRIKAIKPLSLLASNLTISDCMAEMKRFSAAAFQLIPNAETFGIEKQATFEDYYERLIEQMGASQKVVMEIIKQNRKQGKDDEKNDQEQEGEGQEAENDQAKQGKGNGKGKKKEGKEEGEGKGQGEQEQVKNAQEAFERHFNPGKNTNAENWEEDEDISEDLKNFVKNNVDMIKSCGSLAGTLAEAIVEAAGKHEINPRTIMKRFLANSESDAIEDTRTKPNRRRGWNVPGQVKTMSHHVICGIDGSGSVSDKEIQKMVNEINAMTKIAEIDYITWDTKVYEESWEKGKKYKAKGKFKFGNSRGGTEPQCFFEFAKKQKYKNVVCLTDGEFSDFKMPGRFKVCWITTGATTTFMQKTGHVVELKKWLD